VNSVSRRLALVESAGSGWWSRTLARLAGSSSFRSKFRSLIAFADHIEKRCRLGKSIAIGQLVAAIDRLEIAVRQASFPMRANLVSNWISPSPRCPSRQTRQVSELDPRDERRGSREESISGERVGTRGTRDVRGKNNVRRFRPPLFKAGWTLAI